MSSLSSQSLFMSYSSVRPLGEAQALHPGIRAAFSRRTVSICRRMVSSLKLTLVKVVNSPSITARWVEGVGGLVSVARARPIKAPVS